MNNAIVFGTALLAILMLAGIAWQLIASRRANTVLVTGWDDSSGTVETRRLRPDKDGIVTWKNGRDVQARFPLDTSYARPDGSAKVPHFTADVTPGQGRVFKREVRNGQPNLVKMKGRSGLLVQKPVSEDYIPMPGDRMATVVGAHHIREINRSNSLDLGKLLMIGGGILVLLVILIVASLFLLVKVANQTGAV